MAVLAPQGMAFRGSSQRRRCWQQNSRKQHSFSLDVPRKLYDAESLAKKFEDLLESPLSNREEDRFFLYLPRNLSYCEVCSDVIREHVQKKVKLLSNRLCQYDDLPPTPVDGQFPCDFGDDDDGGLCMKKHNDPPNSTGGSPSSPTASKSAHSILKKRAISFPAPRREGKKVVRFADALGLELESIRYLVKKDLHEVIPLQSGQINSIPQNDKTTTTTTTNNNNKSRSGAKKIQLFPAFLAPSLNTQFMQRLRRLNVSLHSVSTADSTVYGIISVMNITFHKTVFVRYTANAWASYHDELASYLEGSSDNDTDKFSFTLFCNPSDLCTRGHALFFAVCYVTADYKAYWDNNDGKNYCIKCEIKELPAVGNHSWVHFL